MSTSLKDQLFQEVLRARTRVYRVGQATPLQLITVPGVDAQIYIKREDLSPINAYKWRGAYNCTAYLHESKGIKTVVAASAGNHAQGVALAARLMGMQAKIFMPLPTPLMKQKAVKLHGGDHVEIILVGDTYDQASDAAKDYTAKHDLAYVHPFDDIYTIAGQATIADEMVLSGEGPFDYVFLQIGGGGMAAGVSAWLKMHHPQTKILGVEGNGQASMAASFAAGTPITLNQVDTFCDGTAVKRPGEITFQICKDNLDDIVMVSNEEVCAAIQQLWDARRVIPEPSGAMGLAGLIQFAQANPDLVKGKKLLAVLCGANMDFGKLAMISSQSAVGAHHRKYLRFHLNEQRGSLLGLLDHVFSDVNVSEFQYGKLSESDGYPVIAFEATPEKMEQLDAELKKKGIPYEDVTSDPDIRYRIINYNAALFKRPVVMHVHFPERRGALREFMRKVSEVSNLCYFNYAYSGESIGRALMGFEFESDENREKFFDLIKDTPVDCKPVPEDAARRILATG
jgi:threonine dehydratase